MFNTSVLDHGFVTLRNLAGPTRRPDCLFDADDRDPANAARMSFDNTDASRTAEQDFRLSAYLMKQWHTSPFEMVECWFEMKMPIFVARQFVRHRTASLNEISGRYVTLPAEWYIPKTVGAKPDTAKQGQANTLPQEIQDRFKKILDRSCAESYANYISALADNVAPEHARMQLHLNHYTRWLWKQNLHNMMGFLRLRDHFHAQLEAQLYAKAIDAHLRTNLPRTMELYDEYRRMKEPLDIDGPMADLDALMAGLVSQAEDDHTTHTHKRSYDSSTILEMRLRLIGEVKTKLRAAGP